MRRSRPSRRLRDAVNEQLTPEDAAMVAFAASRLNDGRTPAQAFGELVDVGVEGRQAALAVCVAAGNPREVAHQRVREFDEVWRALDPASQDTAGSLLEEHGFFDVDVVLDEAQNLTSSHLRQAITAAGYVPSASAHAVFRLLRTGKLREALLFLESLGDERWRENRQFWACLVRAADSLDADDLTIQGVRLRCAERA